MGSVIYSGDRSDRATATEYLERRIAINHAYSSADFDGWLLDKLAIKPGEDILDVGCGSGAQTIPFAELTGPTGSVSSLDISVDFNRFAAHANPARGPRSSRRLGHERSRQRRRQHVCDQALLARAFELRALLLVAAS